MNAYVYVNPDWFHELTLEALNASIAANKFGTPIFGDFATLLAAKLNDMYKRHDDGEKEDIVESLGRDFDGDSSDFNYQLGRKDVITGIADTPPTMQDTQLSIESVNPGGIGMYDVSHEIAGMVLGVPHTVIYTCKYTTIRDEEVDIIRDLIVRGNKHVIVVLFVDQETTIDQVKINAPKLYELMEMTNHLTVFLTYRMERIVN